MVSQKVQRKQGHPLDPESATEVARRLHQDHLLLDMLGNVFPESLDMSSITRVLSLGCSSSEWVQEAAWSFPHVEITAVDTSSAVVDLAWAMARVQGLDNATFLTMNLCDPLDFPPACFDMVYARLLSLAPLPPNAWSSLLRECVRLTRPGGILCLLEGEMRTTTSTAMETMQELVFQALEQTGWRDTVHKEQRGMAFHLEQVLREAGCEHIQTQQTTFEWSVETAQYRSLYQQAIIVTHLLRPFMVESGVVVEDEFDRVTEQMLLDILSDDFRTVFSFLTVVGETPQERAKRP